MFALLSIQLLTVRKNMKTNFSFISVLPVQRWAQHMVSLQWLRNSCSVCQVSSYNFNVNVNCSFEGICLSFFSGYKWLFQHLSVLTRKRMHKVATHMHQSAPFIWFSVVTLEAWPVRSRQLQAIIKTMPIT